MFDYEYIHSELKDYFIGTTDTVVPTEQLEKLYDAFTEKFPDVETKEDYNTIDPDAFIDFIRNFCESEDGIPFYALDEGDEMVRVSYHSTTRRLVTTIMRTKTKSFIKSSRMIMVNGSKNGRRTNGYC